jgi:hypothetical protein
MGLSSVLEDDFGEPRNPAHHRARPAEIHQIHLPSESLGKTVCNFENLHGIARACGQEHQIDVACAMSASTAQRAEQIDRGRPEGIKLRKLHPQRAKRHGAQARLVLEVQESIVLMGGSRVNRRNGKCGHSPGKRP